jgi:hypothetical protein
MLGQGVKSGCGTLGVSIAFSNLKKTKSLWIRQMTLHCHSLHGAISLFDGHMENQVNKKLDVFFFDNDCGGSLQVTLGFRLMGWLQTSLLIPQS